MKHLLFILLFGSSINISAQNINFSDPELKRYLLTEKCVDTSTLFSGMTEGQMNADFNGDDEIQISEALQIEKLFIYDQQKEYDIKSVADLNGFTMLKLLSVILVDSISEFRNMHLDSLKILYLVDCPLTRIVDISNLPNLKSEIRIEGLSDLDTLNLRNGSAADLLSLFYTVKTKFACVDSIAKEYNAINTFAVMLPGLGASINCTSTNIQTAYQAQNEIIFYPNPSRGIYYLKDDEHYNKLIVFNEQGQMVLQDMTGNKKIDLRNFPTGIYLAHVYMGNDLKFIKLSKIE